MAQFSTEIWLTFWAKRPVIGRQGHLPFGEDFAVSGTQENHRFTSYERDSESLTDYAVNRQYSQIVGRFNRVDPVRGSLSDPQELNRYTYVQGDPIGRSDRLGLLSSAVECYTDWRGCEVCYNTITGEQVSRNCVSGAPGMPESTGIDNLVDLSLQTAPQAETDPIPGPEPEWEVVKRYSQTFKCNKNAAAVLQEIMNDFSKFVNYRTAIPAGLLSLSFAPGAVYEGREIEITQTLLSPAGFDTLLKTAVRVESVFEGGFTFRTLPSHPLYPGEITFRAADRGDGQIEFAINVDANFNGKAAKFAFNQFGSDYEDNVWNHLTDKVKELCSK